MKGTAARSTIHDHRRIWASVADVVHQNRRRQYELFVFTEASLRH